MSANLAHWNDSRVQSMYDKTLLAAEIEAIKKYIPRGGSICDAGCGEGEGTLQYAGIEGVSIYAFDSSETRLAAARKLVTQDNVVFQKMNVMEVPLSTHYDVVISQRLLINLDSFEKQMLAFDRLSAMAAGGTVVLSEGSKTGAAALNDFRAVYGLSPIPEPGHNLFIDDDILLAHAKARGLHLIGKESFGAYYLLTRGIQPALRKDFRWDSYFNSRSAIGKMQDLLPCSDKFSRVKVWAFR